MIRWLQCKSNGAKRKGCPRNSGRGSPLALHKMAWVLICPIPFILGSLTTSLETSRISLMFDVLDKEETKN